MAIPMIGLLVDFVLDVLFHRITPLRFTGYGVVLIFVAIGANVAGGAIVAAFAFFGLLILIVAAEILWYFKSEEPTGEAEPSVSGDQPREPPKS